MDPLDDASDPAAVLVAWEGTSAEDKALVRAARKQIPTLRQGQRANTRKVAVVEVIVVLGLFVLSDLTSSNPVLVVGAAVGAGLAGLLFGFRMLAEQIPLLTRHRFGPRLVVSHADFGVEMRMAWGPNLTLVRLPTGVAGVMAGNVVFLVGLHRFAPGQVEAVVALAEAAGSPVESVAG